MSGDGGGEIAREESFKIRRGKMPGMRGTSGRRKKDHWRDNMIQDGEDFKMSVSMEKVERV